MKNHIIQSIIEAASKPINRTGIAAINQLILEVTSEFPGVKPGGFGFQETPSQNETHHRYYLHAALVDPWPLERKDFCGTGESINEAMKSLYAELKAYFLPVAESEILICKEVRTISGLPLEDHRTEYATPA